MHIPKSVLEYYRDRSVSRAVDRLIRALDGERAIETAWDGIGSYNEGLLSAARTRSDYVECLFDVWEHSFGRSRPDKLQGEYFDWREWTPRTVWRRGALQRRYYRDGDPEAGGPSDALGAMLGRDARLRLFVGRFDANGDILEQQAAGLPDGWTVRHYSRHGDYLVNWPADLEDIHGNRGHERERLAREARDMVNCLIGSRPA